MRTLASCTKSHPRRRTRHARRDATGLPAQGPARRVWKRGPGSSVLGRIVCDKGGGLVETESVGEMRLVLQMLEDDTVAAFRPQPETFRWKEHGRRRRYTPDFLVLHRNGSRSYREVKQLTKYLGDPTLDGRLERIASECRARNAAFEVWTEADPVGCGTMRAMVRRRVR